MAATKVVIMKNK